MNRILYKVTAFKRGESEKYTSYRSSIHEVAILEDKLEARDFARTAMKLNKATHYGYNVIEQHLSATGEILKTYEAYSMYWDEKQNIFIQTTKELFE